MNKLVFGILFTFTCLVSQAQHVGVNGVVQDSVDNSPLIGVNVILKHMADTALLRGAVTDLNGYFQFRNIVPGKYHLRMTYVGYTTIEREIAVSAAMVDLGNIKMHQSITTLGAVMVVGDAVSADQKGDTIQYNANAYKTNPDATAEELIAKMPGITADQTGVKTQGEEVRQVLVDGKRFFGDDATIALKNLPAEIIDKIEVFDQLSEQSQFTGFDDGQTQKTINIVTKKGMNTGTFGRVNAGAGDNGRYIAGGNLNSFKGTRKLTLLGLSNNINQQNFSGEDLLGLSSGNAASNGRGGGRGSQNGGGASNFLVGQQKGVATTHSGGLNYSNQWGKDVELSGSYFFNSSDNDRRTNLSRTFIARDSGLVYMENSSSLSTNMNHRANFRIEYNIDSSNSLVITPRISVQLNNADSRAVSTSVMSGSTINELTKTNTSDNLGYSFGNNILFRHRFSKRGRSLSVGFNIDVNDRGGEAGLHSLNQYFDEDRIREIEQRSEQFTKGTTYSSNVAYTEPVGKGQVQFNYSASLSKSDSEKKTFDRNSETAEYDQLNTRLTNIFENEYITNRGGATYRYNSMRKYNIMAGVNFQHAMLASNQDFPRAFSVDRSFQNILPQASLNYRFSQGQNLRIMYRTATNAPSIGQLQNVVNNSNPLFLRSGNSNLRQDFQHNLTFRFGKTDNERNRTVLFLINVGYVKDYIGNATYLNSGKDSVVVNQIELAPGQQLSYPTNVPENWSGRTLFTYGLPVKAIKSSLNLNTGFNYNRTPALINEVENLSHNYAISQGIVLSSNISKQLDFTFSYAANYTIIDNSLISQQSQNNYFTHVSSFRLACQPWKGLVLNSNVTNSFYNGLSSEFDQNIWFWNAALGYKLLKSKALEARLSVFDVLKQNRSISREVTDTFIEDNQNNVLSRYFMVTATYTFRRF